MRLDRNIFANEIMLTDTVFVQTHLIIGPEYGVLVDSGVLASLPGILAMIEAAGLRPEQVRVLLNTHYHHDHIGANDELKARTGCLIAAPRAEAALLTDHEAAFAATIAPVKDWVELGPEDRAFYLEPLGSAARVDLVFDPGFMLDMGDGVVIEALPLPGHSPSHTAYFERGSGTLITGDAAILTSMPWFHIYTDYAALCASLDRLRQLCSTPAVRRVLSSHYAPLAPADFLEVIAEVESFVQCVDMALQEARAQGVSDLNELGRVAARAVGKQFDWRAALVASAHMLPLETPQ